MKVIFTATAEQDLRETMDFYLAPSALSDSFNRMVAQVVDYLGNWPYTGHRRRDLTERDVCFWHENHFLFALHIRDEAASIVAVLNASRDVATILRKRFKRFPLNS